MSNISALIEEYSCGAKLLSDVVRSMGSVDVDAKPIEGKWSIREVVCHLADSEIVYADRMKRVIAEDNPTFFEADPELFMPALSCLRRPLDNELDVIRAIRAHMLPILQSCDANDFQRTGVHSLAGPMTLLTLLQRVTGHLPHHIAFIEQKLKAMSCWSSFRINVAGAGCRRPVGSRLLATKGGRLYGCAFSLGIVYTDCVPALVLAADN
jgi:hypothetical protein